jgi:dGTPase
MGAVSALFFMSELYKKTDYVREHDAESNSAEYRSEFRRDYARLLHCPSFRRLNRKRQLLPNDESDFFRNRLTHSMEVAQIAKTIALKLNKSHSYFNRPSEPERCHIDVDLVEFAGLAHDLGHPPFGHTGEAALDELMRTFGGFEGNAQTIRILTRLEKKVTVTLGTTFGINNDPRVGLNLTYRTIASVLKYDHEITATRAQHGTMEKGYYASEKAIVGKVKQAVSTAQRIGAFKTVECAIMDISDDIAYSTYDLEDAFKAGLLSPLSLFSTIDRMDTQRRTTFLQDIVHSVQEVYATADRIDIEQKAVEVLRSFMTDFIGADKAEDLRALPAVEGLATSAILSDKLAGDGHARIAMTSKLVNMAVESVEVEFTEDDPALSKVRLSYESLIRIETLKRVAWNGLIDSRKLKMIEWRERNMIREIFETLADSNGGHELLPDDFRHLYELAGPDDATKKRIVCDYIAGMTDRYAEGFIDRLRRNTDSIFLPF